MVYSGVCSWKNCDGNCSAPRPLEKYVRRRRDDGSESKRFLAAKRDTNRPAAARKSLRTEIKFAGI
jgi:uncharacterized protein involved in tellurium resistance